MLPPALPSRFQDDRDLDRDRDRDRGWDRDRDRERDRDRGLPPRPIPGTPEESVPKPPPTNAGKGKSAGFKPIGQQSSAVKRFFPGDDDDDDLLSPRSAHHEEPPPPRPILPIPSLPQRPLTNDLNTRIQRNGDRENGRPEQIVVRPKEHVNTEVERKGYTPPRPTPVPPRGMAMVEEQKPPDIQTPVSAHHMHEVRRLEPLRDHNSYTPEVSRPPSPIQHGEELYQIMSQVGEGTFGKVYKARNTGNGRYVALKRIRMEAEREGFPVTAMREIKLLQSLRHDNIVRLYEMMVSNGMSFFFGLRG